MQHALVILGLPEKNIDSFVLIFLVIQIDKVLYHFFAVHCSPFLLVDNFEAIPGAYGSVNNLLLLLLLIPKLVLQINAYRIINIQQENVEEVNKNQ